MLSRKHDRSSSFSISIAHRETIQPEKSDPEHPNTIDYYIQQITEKLNNPQQPSYRVAIISFQKFIANKYRNEKVISNEQEFIISLFDNISKRSFLEFTVLARAILGVDLGDKLTLANLIAKKINQLTPEKNKMAWEAFETILLFLEKCLKNAMPLILFNLKEIAGKWIFDENNKSIVPGISLLCILLSKFHASLQRYFPQIAGFITCALTTGGAPPEVFDAIQILIDIQNSNKASNYKLDQFCLNLSFIMNEKRHMLPIAKALQMILDGYPEGQKKPQLKFLINPIQLLKIKEDNFFKKKDNNTNNGDIISGVQLAPLYIQSVDKNLEPDILTQLLNCYYELLSRRSSYRIDALVSFGNVLFQAKRKGITTTPELIQKFMKKFPKAFDEPQGYYAYIGLLAHRDIKTFDEDASPIFACKQINQWMVDGFYNYLQIDNQKQDVIHRSFIVFFNEILLNQIYDRTQSSQIIFALNGILKLDIWKSPHLIPIPLALKYSLLLDYSDLSVKKLAAEFVLKYHNQHPSVEMLCRILSVISTEFNDIRIHLFDKARKDIIDPSIVPLLATLLHDSSRIIQKQALLYLTRLIQLNGVSNLISDFLKDTKEEILLSSSLSTKDQLRFYSIICEAYHETKNPVFKTILLPYADFLINHILEGHRLPLISMTVLSYMISISLPETIKRLDLDLLVAHIENSLVPHSSKRRLDSTFKLLNSCLKKTPLHMTIYTKHINIVNKLHELARLNSEQVNQTQLLKTLSMIGAINLTIEQNIDNDDDSQVVANTPMYFISKSNVKTSVDKLLYAAQGIATKSLLEIMSEQKLSTIFSTSTSTLQTIMMNSIDNDIVLFDEILDQISTVLADKYSANASTMVESLPTMIELLGEKIKPAIPSIIDSIITNWNNYDKFVLLSIIETIPKYGSPEMLEPYILKIATLLVSDINSNMNMAIMIYKTFGTLAPYNYDDIIQNVIYPPLLEWIQNHAINTRACEQMLCNLTLLLTKGKGGRVYCSQIIHTMIKMVQINNDLSAQALEPIREIAYQMGPNFLIYLPAIQSCFKFEPQELTRLIQHYLAGKTMEYKRNSTKSSSNTFRQDKQKVQVNNLSFTNFAIPPNSQNEDVWNSWWDKITEKLFTNSSSAAITACKDLSNKYTILKDKLFPVGFAIARCESNQQVSFDQNLSEIFQYAPNILLRNFLSIYEIFDALEIRPQMTDSSLIASKAVQLNNYPFAVRVYENMKEPLHTKQIVESLITLYQKLGFTLSANGILHSLITRPAELSENLGLWDEALKQYVEQGKSQTLNSIDKYLCLDQKSIIGAMNCLNHLTRFQELNELTNSILNNKKFANQSELLSNCRHYAASAAWHMIHLDQFKQLASKLEETENNYFYLAVCNVLNGKFDVALEYIKKIQDNANDKLFPSIAYNYDRIYEDFSLISMLSEVKEVIQYHGHLEMSRSAEKSVRMSVQESMNRIRTIWYIRFEKMRAEPSVMLNHLCIRSLILPISDQRNNFLSLIKASIHSKRFELAEYLISLCQANDADENEQFKIMKSKLLWEQNHKIEAIDFISQLKPTMKANIILANWLLETGDEMRARKTLEKDISNQQLPFTEWNTWSNVNLALFEKDQSKTQYLVDSLDGIMNALSIAKKEYVLMLSLRLLDVLFNFERDEVFHKFQETIRSGKIALSVWPNVVIQLLSKLSSSNLLLKETVGELITTVGLEHPHAVLLSLMVSTYLDDTERQRTSIELIDRIAQKHPDVVNSLEILSTELQKVALTWWEVTYSKIDEASMLYTAALSQDSNTYIDMLHESPEKFIQIIDDVCKQLESLDEIVLKQPITFYEISYCNSFFNTIETASNYRKLYQKTKDRHFFTNAWAFYTNAFYQIRPIIARLNSFDICDSSPYLSSYSIETSKIPVPGTYSVTSGTNILISSFDQTVKIMDSKQRPRCLVMRGDDGKKSTFLLKAHEDTRLDERVMQLFSFINTCLFDKKKEPDMPDNWRNSLAITTYKVSPLTPEVGLIGFVKNCETIANVIQRSREKIGINERIEYETTLQLCPNFVEMPVGPERIAFFKEGIKACDGNDLKKELFANAFDSRDWLDRRMTYSSSLAMTSMAGYVLGLGDRHLSNIMINKRTAKLVHIDFGDSFEVAQHRQRFPEKVPFRLTRLLINALEVSQIEGTFRSSCEKTMNVMRMNCEPIIGLLSAFISDPLKQWSESSVANTEEKESSSAKVIIKRIKDKLSGNDFGMNKKLDVEIQVNNLINEATDPKNLCQMYIGWYPWW